MERLDLDCDCYPPFFSDTSHNCEDSGRWRPRPSGSKRRRRVVGVSPEPQFAARQSHLVGWRPTSRQRWM